MAKGLAKLLTDHRRGKQEQRLKAGSGWENHDLVFPNEIGAPLHLDTVRAAFKRALTRAKLPKDFSMICVIPPLGDLGKSRDLFCCSRTLI